MKARTDKIVSSCLLFVVLGLTILLAWKGLAYVTNAASRDFLRLYDRSPPPAR
jgi:hypothetical protein